MSWVDALHIGNLICIPLTLWFALDREAPELERLGWLISLILNIIAILVWLLAVNAKGGAD